MQFLTFSPVSSASLNALNPTVILAIVILALGVLADSSPTMGGGADARMAIEIPRYPGSLRQESIELSDPAPSGMRASVVPSAAVPRAD